jgi:hypothetical protein
MQSEQQINEEELTEMISEADHIHNKAIFDCVNEALNLHRPYGVSGEPMPWSSRPRKNVYLAIEDNLESIQKTLESVLISVKKRVLQWAETQAGSVNSYLPNNEVSKMLSQQVFEKEIERIIHEDFQTCDDSDWQGHSENI